MPGRQEAHLEGEIHAATSDLVHVGQGAAIVLAAAGAQLQVLGLLQLKLGKQSHRVSPCRRGHVLREPHRVPRHPRWGCGTKTLEGAEPGLQGPRVDSTPWRDRLLTPDLRSRPPGSLCRGPREAWPETIHMLAAAAEKPLSLVGNWLLT